MIRAICSACVCVLFAEMLAGCASGPSYADVAAKMPSLTADQGRMLFYRERSPLGAAIQPAISVNGENVGTSTPGGFFYVDRPAGNYVISCSTEAEHRLTVALGAGETRYVRTFITFGLFVGQVHPTLEDPGTAMKTLKNCSLTNR